MSKRILSETLTFKYSRPPWGDVTEDSERPNTRQTADPAFPGGTREGVARHGDTLPVARRP